MFDWAKRNAKVQRKLEEIYNASPETQHKVLEKALRALWSFGVQMERERLLQTVKWCNQCGGRGWMEITVPPFPCCVMHTAKKSVFCKCDRGNELRAALDDLKSGKARPVMQIWRRRVTKPAE